MKSMAFTSRNSLRFQKMKTFFGLKGYILSYVS